MYCIHCAMYCLVVVAGNARLEQEVLDLVPEDGDGVKQKRATYHWDKVRGCWGAPLVCSWCAVTSTVLGCRR